MAYTQIIQGKLKMSPIALNISMNKQRLPSFTNQQFYIIFLYKNHAVKTTPITLQTPNSLSYNWNTETSQEPLELDINTKDSHIIEIMLLSLPVSHSLSSSCILPNVLSRLKIDLIEDPKFLNLNGKLRNTNIYRTEVKNCGVLEVGVSFKSTIPSLPPKNIIREELMENQAVKISNEPDVRLQKVYDKESNAECHQEQKHFKRLRKAGSFLKNNHRKWRQSIHTDYKDDLDDESTFEATITSTEYLTIYYTNEPRSSMTSMDSSQYQNLTNSSPTISSSSSSSSFSTNLSTIPYSAASVDQSSKQSLPPLPFSQQLNPPPPKPQPISPETYKLLTSIQESHPPPSFFETLIDPGLSEYKGDSQWGKDRIRDSMINMNGMFLQNGDFQRGVKPPKLPPKIPLGLNKMEWFVLKKSDVLNYVRMNEGSKGLCI